MFGVAVLVANAPFQAPDENDHFARVFQLSEGTLIGEKHAGTAGGEQPRAAIAVTNTEGIPFHSERKMTYGLFGRLLHPAFVDWRHAPRTFLNFPHTVVYSPAGYLPQVVAVYLGRQLRIGALGLMYLARLSGLAACVALGYAALRVLPIYRWTTLVLLLCPMSLYLFGSVAPDGLLITGATLLMAYLARLAVARGPAGFREQATILVLAGLLALTKPVYLPFSAVALIVVVPRLPSSRSRARFGALVFIGCLVPALLWGRVAVNLFVPSKGGIFLDPVAQGHHIAEMPLAFVALVAHTIRLQFLDNYRWMVGTLGWGDTPMPGWFYPTFGFGVLGCLVLESAGARGVGWRLRGVMVTAAALTVLLIYAAQYSSWNPPGSQDPIDGIEGRYFLPILLLLVLSFPPLARRPWGSIAALAAALSVLCVATCLWAVVVRYYVSAPPSIQRGGTARLINLSTRALVGTKENLLITGIVVGGHGQETLLIRAAGPGLGRFGLSGVLTEPAIAVLDAKGSVLAANTGWETSPDRARLPIACAAVGAFEFAAHCADSALILSVPEGNYTFEVSGAHGASGLALAEIYELGHSGTRLANLSSRGYVGRGANQMIVGFVVGGNGALPLLGRADGPSLRPFGVTGVLADPTLDISPFPEGALVNQGWSTSPASVEIKKAAARVGAFPLPADGADSAAVVSVRPGAYTMKVYGAGGATGVALAEVYELP